MTRIKRLLNPAPPRPFPAGLLGTVLAAAILSPLMGSPAPETPKEPIRVSAQLLARIDTLAAKEGIDPQLLRAMAWAESRFDPDARSPRGALGILQVMPETAKKYGAVDLANREQVAAAGVRYLKSLLTRYPGDLARAVAAYNCGEEAVETGRITEEATRYRSQVLDLLKDKLIQALPPLAPSEVRGELRRRPDGKTWMLRFEASYQNGFRMELMQKRGESEMRLGLLDIGSTDAPRVESHWIEAHPEMHVEIPEEGPLQIRCIEPSLGLEGETHLLSGQTTYAFQLVMKPKEATK